MDHRNMERVRQNAGANQHISVETVPEAGHQVSGCTYVKYSYVKYLVSIDVIAACMNGAFNLINGWL